MALALPFDVRDASATEAALASLPDAFKEIDLLINNAGLALGTAPAAKARVEDWHTMIDTNVTGLVTLTHRLLPGLIERKGAVINISSVAATYPYPGGNVYGGTKAFVSQFSLGLRSDLHARDLDRAGHGRNRIHARALGWQPGCLRYAIQGRQSAHSRGHCGDAALGRDAAAAHEHQPPGIDAGASVLRAIPSRSCVGARRLAQRAAAASSLFVPSGRMM
jgi:NAD(P)-dependent dehydrogenase (short-subunit alcohol dehydrogenase family)